MLALLLIAMRPAQAGDPTSASFDADQAMAGAAHLAGTIGERAAGTPGETVAADWIAQTLRTYGYQVTLQSFPIARFAVPYTATNVIAVKPGAPGYGTLYIGAHFDTIFRPTPEWPLGGPGANDNASGVAVMLETAARLGQRIS